MKRIVGTTTFFGFVGLVAVATVLTLALAIGATARPERGEGGPGRMLERLDLSAETRAALEAVMERSHEEARPLHEALEQEREALEALLDQDEVDLDAALAQVERVGEARTALSKHRVTTKIGIRELLTPEEREVWDEAREARKDRRQRSFERFRGRHGRGYGMGHGFHGSDPGETSLP